MRFKVRKSTIGDYNEGHCDNNNNAHYKGATICWVIYTKDALGNIAALSRKSDALLMAEWLDTIGYNGTGDPVAMFTEHLINVEDFDTMDKLKEM